MVAGARLRDPSAFESMEAALGVFAAAGIEPPEAAVFLKTVNDFVLGFTIEQQAVLTPSGDRNPGYDLEVRKAAIDPALYPLSRSLGPVLLDNYDASFERGLDYFISGLAAECAKISGVDTAPKSGARTSAHSRRP